MELPVSQKSPYTTVPPRGQTDMGPRANAREPNSKTTNRTRQIITQFISREEISRTSIPQPTPRGGSQRFRAIFQFLTKIDLYVTSSTQNINNNQKNVLSLRCRNPEKNVLVISRPSDDRWTGRASKTRQGCSLRSALQEQLRLLQAHFYLPEEENSIRRTPFKQILSPSSL